MVHDLEDKTVFVLLKNADKDIALFEKYDQNKQAERLKRQVEEENQRRREAVENYYHFSPFEFIDQTDTTTYLSGYFMTFAIEENPATDNKNEQYRQIVSIQSINPNYSQDNNTKIESSRASITQTASYDLVVKTLNQKLEKIAN